MAIYLGKTPFNFLSSCVVLLPVFLLCVTISPSMLWVGYETVSVPDHCYFILFQRGKSDYFSNFSTRTCCEPHIRNVPVRNF